MSHSEEMEFWVSAITSFQSKQGGVSLQNMPLSNSMQIYFIQNVQNQNNTYKMQNIDTETPDALVRS